MPLEDTWRILGDDDDRMVVALLPTERGDADPARRSGLPLSTPVLATDVSVGCFVLAAGGSALVCGKVVHVNIDADSLVIHKHGGTDPDLARRIFEPKYHARHLRTGRRNPSLS